MKKYATFQEYARFSDYLLTTRIYLDPSVTFRGICHGLGLPRRRLDNTLMAELGLAGREIMEKFREGDMRMLLLLDK